MSEGRAAKKKRGQVGEPKVYTRNGHAWRERTLHPEGLRQEYYCARRGCRKVVSRIGRPPDGICTGGKIVPEKLSPRLTV